MKNNSCLNIETSMTPQQAGKNLNIILAKLRAGADYERCEKEAEPLIALINKRAGELARVHGVRPRHVSFIALAR